MIMNLLKKIKNRQLAKKEHKNITELYDLGFNAELQVRLAYKKRLLKNELIEEMNLNINDSIDICYLESIIREKQQTGKIDLFYNRI